MRLFKKHGRREARATLMATREAVINVRDAIRFILSSHYYTGGF
jgi:hypothetical protein